MTGRLIGVGVGPGDPELLTLKAVRALREADVIAHFAKVGHSSHARASAEQFFAPTAVDCPLLYPITTELPAGSPEYRSAIGAFFDQSAAQVAEYLDSGRDVAVLSEGDPLFFGSYMHIHVRLQGRYPVQVIPGVTAMSAAWSAAGVAMVHGDQALTVVPGTLSEEELQRRLRQHESAVVMKVGRNLGKIRRALIACDRLSHSIYVERASLAQQKISRLAEKDGDHAPYFAMVLVSAPGSLS
jgi:precorrin-2/cobalt-factor-2 C20-methyltransferase